MATWKAGVEATVFDSSRFPPEGVPEIAVAGRSNVGKSTLINSLLGGKFAHVGGTPGKTRSVNFYSVESGSGLFRLTDLPGYGYAERSKSEKKEWSQLTTAYVGQRKSLILVCHLADFRHGLLGNDRILQDWLCECGRPILVVFTKGDKITRGKRQTMLRQYVRDGLKSLDVPIVTSGEERFGINELRSFLESYVAEAAKTFMAIQNPR
ncbi:MAG: ribosome biogenesis GTP-binding protein YihA/YsxC [Synergistaceae bacterium]|jgi:GTP-binding protein|nr:ribosome biogenesis GTP-binding protein YihA/YsxC [Synergistaceae bacterium]